MVFGLFKKKKKVPRDGTQETTKPEKPSKSSKTKEKTPKNSKETPKTETQQHPTEPQRIQDDNEDQWKYESIIQFLQSPLWRIPLVEFVDEHCFVFDNPKEDKPEYIEIHEVPNPLRNTSYNPIFQAYKKMVERLVEEMLSELEIEIEKFTEIVHAGVNDPTYKKTFEQFLTVDNFTVFKKIMFKRNKELELEALQQLHEIDKQKAMSASGVNNKERERLTRENEQDIIKLMQEKEEAELEHALALSLAVEEERQKLVEQEDYELQEAMRQSEIEYTKFQKDVRAKEEEIERERHAKEEELERYEREKRQREELQRQQRERELAKEQEIARIHAEEVARKKSQENEGPKSLSELVEEEKIEHRPEETRSQELDRISRKKLEPLKNAPKPTTPELAEQKRSSIFPPIKGSADYDPMQDYTEDTEKKPVKHEVKDETLEERKKRLQAQRDLILAKKKAEREAELKSYEARRGNVKPTTQKSVENVSNLEIMRRKEIYGKLRNEF